MEGVGEDPTIFTARSLPSDPRFFATVTNTYLGTRVYHDILHVSGTYNGAQGHTHRAVLPSPLNVQLEASDTAEQLTQTFALDTNTGTTTALLPSTERAPQLRHPGTALWPGRRHASDTCFAFAQGPRRCPRVGPPDETYSQPQQPGLLCGLSRLLPAHPGGAPLQGIPAHIRPPHAASRPGLQCSHQPFGGGQAPDHCAAAGTLRSGKPRP